MWIIQQPPDRCSASDSLRRSSLRCASNACYMTSSRDIRAMRRHRSRARFLHGASRSLVKALWWRSPLQRIIQHIPSARHRARAVALSVTRLFKSTIPPDTRWMLTPLTVCV
eukprot:scaffold19101_cov53-Phaeocystis_antarctica.AAC.3